MIPGGLSLEMRLGRAPAVAPDSYSRTMRSPSSVARYSCTAARPAGPISSGRPATNGYRSPHPEHWRTSVGPSRAPAHSGQRRAARTLASLGDRARRSDASGLEGSTEGSLPVRLGLTKPAFSQSAMRNDVHDLSLEERIGPLVAAAPQAHTRWL